MRFTRICCVSLVTAMIPTIPGQSLRADERLDALVKNVEAAEALFANIDVEYTTSSISTVILDTVRTSSESTATRETRQGTLFRYTQERTEHDLTDKTVRTVVRSEYDGLTTRFDRGNKRATVHVGAANNFASFHPYQLLHGHTSTIPMSVYLRGYDRYPVEPQVRTVGRERVEFPALKAFSSVSYYGEVDFGGLKCEKVTLIERSEKTGKPQNRHEYWFAKDRNWLPVRSFRTFYQHYVPSQGIPVAEGIAEDLREIEPGIWAPFKTRFTKSYATPTSTEGRPAPAHRHEIQVKSLMRKPANPLEYFNGLQFADGTWVYEYDAGGRKLGGYIVGAPSAPAAQTVLNPWYARVPWKQVIPGFAAALVIAYAIWAGRRNAAKIKPG